MREWSEKIIASKKRIAIPILNCSSMAMTVVNMDLSIEAEAFGAEIVLLEHNGRRVEGRLVSSKEEIEVLEVPSLDKGRVQEYIKSIRMIAHSVREELVISSCVGPYSLAGMLYGMGEISNALCVEPEAIKLLLDKCTVFISNYCQALKEAGADGVMLAEPAAGLLSNDLCQEFSSYFVKKIVEAVQDDSFMVVLHNCGNKGHCTAAMTSVGAMGYHFGNAIDMVAALDASPKDALVMGNIDPVSIMKQSTAAQVKQAVADILERTKDYPNYILSTGCDTPPEVPEENIIAFYEALAEFNK